MPAGAGLADGGKILCHRVGPAERFGPASMAVKLHMGWLYRDEKGGADHLLPAQPAFASDAGLRNKASAAAIWECALSR